MIFVLRLGACHQQYKQKKKKLFFIISSVKGGEMAMALFDIIKIRD